MNPMYYKDRPCPWGAIQAKTVRGPGIEWISTAGHGGFVLDKVAYSKMPHKFRRASFTQDQYFEEDLSWCAVVLTFQSVINWSDESQREAAVRVAEQTWKRYYEPLLGSIEDVWKSHARLIKGDWFAMMTWSACSKCNDAPPDDDSGLCGMCRQGVED